MNVETLNRVRLTDEHLNTFTTWTTKCLWSEVAGQDRCDTWEVYDVKTMAMADTDFMQDPYTTVILGAEFEPI